MYCSENYHKVDIPLKIMPCNQYSTKPTHPMTSFNYLLFVPKSNNHPHYTWNIFTCLNIMKMESQIMYSIFGFFHSTFVLQLHHIVIVINYPCLIALHLWIIHLYILLYMDLWNCFPFGCIKNNSIIMTLTYIFIAHRNKFLRGNNISKTRVAAFSILIF